MFEMKERDCLARICMLETPHGRVETPAVMPVINPNRVVVSANEMKEMGFQAVITNSYIIYRNRELREKALEKGVHSLIDFDGVVMTDSGTFQSYVYGDVEITNEKIVNFQKEIGSDIATILDVFVTEDMSRESAANGVMETYRRGKEALEIWDTKSILAGTIQGGTYLDLRRKSAKLMSSLGFKYYPIGGVVPLLENYRYADIAKIVINVKKTLPPSFPIHLFGAGHPMFLPLAVALGVDFFDSASYIKYARDDRILTPSGTVYLEELKYPLSPILERHDDVKEMDREERIRVLAKHNLYVIAEEVRRIKQRIHEETFWEYLEERCSSHPRLMESLRIIYRNWRFFEEYESISKKSAMLFSMEISFKRPIVMRLKKRIKERYCPSGRKVVICCKDRPYSRYIPLKRNLAIYVKTPFGEVPLELDMIYPVAQSEYMEFRCRKTIDIDRFEDEPNADVRKLKAIADFQFGIGAGDSLFSGEIRITKTKATGTIRTVYDSDGNVIATMRTQDGYLALRKEGAIRLFRSGHALWVEVTEDSAEFNKKGKNVFAKFVVDAHKDIRVGDEVVIIHRNEPIAVGRALMNRREMLSFERGMAVDVREGFG